MNITFLNLRMSVRMTQKWNETSEGLTHRRTFFSVLYNCLSSQIILLIKIDVVYQVMYFQFWQFAPPPQDQILSMEIFFNNDRDSSLAMLFPPTCNNWLIFYPAFFLWKDGPVLGHTLDWLMDLHMYELHQVFLIVF